MRDKEQARLKTLRSLMIGVLCDVYHDATGADFIKSSHAANSRVANWTDKDILEVYAGHMAGELTIMFDYSTGFTTLEKEDEQD